MEGVAPFVGAWIEIVVFLVVAILTKGSLPSWERGLKSECGLKAQHGNASLPSWERGLKWHCGRVQKAAPGRSLRGSVD